MGDDDPLTLVPDYRFEWDDGTVRRTDDDDFVEDRDAIRPEHIETLAAIGKRDENCDVTLIGMGS